MGPKNGKATTSPTAKVIPQQRTNGPRTLGISTFKPPVPRTRPANFLGKSQPSGLWGPRALNFPQGVTKGPQNPKNFWSNNEIPPREGKANSVGPSGNSPAALEMVPFNPNWNGNWLPELNPGPRDHRNRSQPSRNPR